MTGRTLHTEQAIRAAGAANVAAWRAGGWRLPEHRAEHVAVILGPERDTLAPQRGRDKHAA